MQDTNVISFEGDEFRIFGTKEFNLNGMTCHGGVKRIKTVLNCDVEILEGNKESMNYFFNKKTFKLVFKTSEEATAVRLKYL